MFGEQYGYAYGGESVPSGWADDYPPSPGNGGNGSNNVDVLVHADSTAGTAYHLSDLTYAIAAAFQIPAATGTVAPTATPSPKATPGGSAFDSIKKTTPSGGSFAYYPSSPYHDAIPASPALVSALAIGGVERDAGVGRFRQHHRFRRRHERERRQRPDDVYERRRNGIRVDVRQGIVFVVQLRAAPRTFAISTARR